jgi:hypothetical protein
MKNRYKDVGILASVGIALCVFALCSCSNPYKPFWVAANTTAKARNEADSNIDRIFRVKKSACQSEYAKHKDPKTYVECVEGSKEAEAIRAWVMYAMPAIDGALKLLQTALIMSEKIGDDSDAAKKQWIIHLKAALCVTAKVVSDFGHLFPDKGKQALSYINMVKLVTCDK